ncbi:MAG: hypothetical protein ABR572_12750 [Cryomorphaceae bacterium]
MNATKRQSHCPQIYQSFQRFALVSTLALRFQHNCHICCIFILPKSRCVMESLSDKSAIANALSSVRTFSFQEKKTPVFDEQQINELLDAILDFKSKLNIKTTKIHSINERLEKLTWLNDVNEDSLMLLNDLISLAKDLHSSLLRQYISLGLLRKRGIAKEEIKGFKNSIDELKESFEDLESVFFFLPEMPEFVETTKRLSLV